jgi:predicted protein tyrosine phosphatase
MNARVKDIVAKLYRPPRQGRQLIALSRADAERIPLVAGVAMISITAPEKASAQVPEYKNLLRLSFADVDFLSESLSTKAAVKITAAMTKEDARKILVFVEALPPSVHTLLVHCEGGLSRSCGVVTALHQLYGYDVEEARLVQANQSVATVLLEVAQATQGKKILRLRKDK